MPLYDFTCAAGHTTERRVLARVDSVVCACGEAAQREKVFRFAGQVAKPLGTPIAHFSEAAQELKYRHDSTDDPAARAATRPDVWRPALKRAEVKQLDRHFGVSDETRWTDPRPKQTEQMRKAEVG